MEMIGGNTCLLSIWSMTNISKVVNVGCSTGVAIVQIANMFLFATIYGLDILLISEAGCKMAIKNAFWAVENVLKVNYNDFDNSVMSREIFTPGELDYIFVKMLFFEINNRLSYFSNASHALKSSAIIEHTDLD